jgi:hypothetical protein
MGSGSEAQPIRLAGISISITNAAIFIGPVLSYGVVKGLGHGPPAVCTETSVSVLPAPAVVLLVEVGLPVGPRRVVDVADPGGEVQLHAGVDTVLPLNNSVTFSGQLSVIEPVLNDLGTDEVPAQVFLAVAIQGGLFIWVY